MKFAALVLLLVVGSQAASLQADAPDQFTQFRAKLKEGAIRVLAPFDQTSHKTDKDNAIEMVDARLGDMITMVQSLVSTASDATEGLRQTAQKDVQELQASLSVDAEKVRENLLKHLQDYVKAGEDLKNFLLSKKPEVEEFKTKVAAAVESIIEKVPANWEETKSSLMPIIEKLRAHAAMRGQELKTMIEPYIADYRESVQAYMQNPGDKTAPLLEESKAKLSAYLTALAQSLSQ